MGYLTNFIVYTLAMVGVIVIALLVFKGTTGGGIKGGSKYLKVLDTLSIGPRKTLYIVSAGKEKFLIAGDVDKTSLISKLNCNENPENEQNSAIAIDEIANYSTKSFKETMVEIPKQKTYIDRSCLGIQSKDKKPYDSVMKNLAERIRS